MDCAGTRRLSMFAGVTLLLLGFSFASAPPPAGAACAVATKSIGGTYQGEDGRYLSALIGLEIFDGSGQKIGLDGCPSGGGYSTTHVVNQKYPDNTCCVILPGEGSTSSPYNGYDLEKTWQVDGLPSNAATVWIEAYPKEPPGTTSHVRYGNLMRRAVPANTTDLDLRAPQVCAQGGDTGSIVATAYHHGKKVTPSTRISAFSRDPDRTSPPMGFGLGAAGIPSTIDALEPGSYTLLVSYAGAERREAVAVNRCQPTYVNVSFGGSIPSGSDSPGIVRGGVWHLRNSNSSGPADITVDSYGSNGSRVVSGDWDGDGIDTVGVISGNTFYLRNSNSAGPADLVLSYGRPGDYAVSGDWNGDGRDTIGVRRNNVFYLRNSNTTGVADITLGYGKNTDFPVVGDWDGDGIDTFGVRRNNAFHLRNRNTTGVADITLGYGKNTDFPVVGDWDGDGIDTFGVRRGSQYLLRNHNSSGNANLVFDYGLASDLPVVGNWDGS